MEAEVQSLRGARDDLMSQQLLAGILDAIPVRVFWKDEDLVYLGCNAAFARDAGFADPREIIGKDDYQLVWREQAELYRSADREVIDSNQPKLFMVEPQTTPSGDLITLLTSKVPLHGPQGEVRGMLGTYLDITDRVRAEAQRDQVSEQLRVAQKMEAIGSLAGGVAHDFNNLLSVILSYTDFALEAVRRDDPLRGDLLEVKGAAERAAVLTRQLLAFSRKQVLQPVPTNLNAIATGLDKMLQRIVGEDVELRQALAPDLGRTRADPGQIEQVLMNLVVNARDAMPTGGRLTISTANLELDAVAAARHDVAPGAYVSVTVADSGCGMDAPTRDRVFEPFFTTKEKGRGTGLGLSTVYGIIKQSDGAIWVDSEPGQGTAVHICLPQDLSAPSVTAVQYPAVASRPTGSETILVVEDDAVLRDVVQRSLGAAGYTVLAAAGGEEALRLAGVHSGPIHLLLTDVVMPSMSGRAVAEELVRERPTLDVLYMSGYTGDALGHHGVLEAGTHFLAKPFTPSDLTRRVREVLDSGSTALTDELA